MTRKAFLLLALLLVSCNSTVLLAQKYQVKTIQFKGDKDYSDAELLAASGLKHGLSLSSAEMDEHSKLLMRSGVFGNVAYTFNGQDLVFQIIPAPTLYPVHLENIPLLGGANLHPELDIKLHEKLPLYHGKVPSEAGLQDDVRAELESLLQAHGIAAKVVSNPYSEDKSTQVTAISYSIASPPVKVGEVRVEGSSPALAGQVMAAAKPEAGEAYSTAETAGEIANKIKGFYASLGYLEADVQASAGTSADPAPVVDAQGIHVPVAVHITEGSVFKLAGVQLAPGLLVSQQEYDKAATLHPGEVANRAQLEPGWMMIRNRYKSKGYLLVEVKPQPVFDHEKGTVSFRVTVEPGDVYHMNTVKFQNVSDDLRRLLLHNWQMAPDDVFDENYVRTFPASAAKLDPALGSVLSHVYYEWHLSVDRVTHAVDVVITLEKLK